MVRAKKLKITKRQAIQYWKVRIDVEDPKCLFSINPKINYKRVFKATNPNAAIRAAANYCTRYMMEYPGVTFTYSTKEVDPYQYVNFITATKDNL
jgi:hypothetical protein